MKESRINSHQNVTIEFPAPSLPRKRLILGIGATLLIGLLIVGLFLGPEYLVWGLAGIGIGIPLLSLVWFRPEFGLLTLIFLTSSFVQPDIIDIRLEIGGGFDLRDLVLIGIFVLLIVRELYHKSLSIPWWKVAGPLILFLSIAVFSTINAIAFQKVEPNWALSDMRILSYYLTFFMVIWSIKSTNQFQALLIGLFILADLTTIVILLQQFVGAGNPLLRAMVTVQDWRVVQETGGVRVIPAGHILMHFMWFIALGLLIFARLTPNPKRFLIFQLLFIGVGHIFTYMRSQWVAMLIGFVLMCSVIVYKFRSLVPKYLLLGFSIIVIIAFLLGMTGISKLAQTPFVAGIESRFGSILTPGETFETDSLQWRRFENTKALASILQHPLLGVGLGGRYRELTTLQGETLGQWTNGSLAAGVVSRFTRYVHNSYLSITVKMGIPALIVILWFCIAFLINGWKVYQGLINPEYKSIVLGVITGFAGLLAWCYFHAHLIKAESTPVIGLMIGLVAVVDSLQKREQLSSNIKG